jgi:mediator of RNA polymerase II transcription subunit 12
MLSSFASGNSNYLPVQEHVAFLFDLMELALSIYDLIDVCIQVIVTRGLEKLVLGLRAVDVPLHPLTD